jgi:hypothetical protein
MSKYLTLWNIGYTPDILNLLIFNVYLLRGWFGTLDALLVEIG